MMTLGMSAVAFAEPPTPVQAEPVIESMGQDGRIYNGKADDDNPTFKIDVSRLSLKFGDGRSALAYCIELSRTLNRPPKYTETGWEESGIANLSKVQWVLTHAYPNVSVDALAAAAGATKPTAPQGKQFTEENLRNFAYAATQAAIWSFSDSERFALAAPSDEAMRKVLAGKAKGDQFDWERFVAYYPFIVKLHKYLTSSAKDEKEPTTLAINPASAKGNVGAMAGPFTVVSNVGEVELTATGGTLVDKDRKAVTKLNNGDKFYVDCKAEGTVKIEGKSKFNVPIGRVFSYKKRGPKDSGAQADEPEAQILTRHGGKSPQKLILAGYAGKELTATAAATCAAAPGLPVTGAPVAGTVAAGMVLLATGAGLFFVRRRRIRFTA
jgi:TQXA domain-containing protein/LPXTG-motif cell wall-anchored protein